MVVIGVAKIKESSHLSEVFLFSRVFASPSKDKVFDLGASDRLPTIQLLQLNQDFFYISLVIIDYRFRASSFPLVALEEIDCFIEFHLF